MKDINVIQNKENDLELKHFKIRNAAAVYKSKT